MLDVLLLLYCGAVGFVAAGIAASFYTLVTAEPARFRLFSGTIPGLVTSFIFSVLTGPVLSSPMSFVTTELRACRFSRC